MYNFLPLSAAKLHKLWKGMVMKMNLLKRLFCKKTKETPPMPQWDTIVEMMYDKGLDNFIDEVVKVIYSKDRSMRYVVLKGENELFTYRLEVIHRYDEEEWVYISSHENALPAMWNTLRGNDVKSVFENTDELLREIKSEAEYKRYF